MTDLKNEYVFHFADAYEMIKENCSLITEMTEKIVQNFGKRKNIPAPYWIDYKPSKKIMENSKCIH